MLTPEPRRAAPPLEVLPYPNGIARRLLRAPILLHRLGLGALLNQLHVVILTTRGRKSGLPRYALVEYRMHGSKVYLISAWGERPHWVQNLIADPQATVQTGGRIYGAQAHVVYDTGEILRAFLLFRKRAPAVYDGILARLTEAESVDTNTLPDLARQLTVVRLDVIRDKHTLPGVKTDLAWLWGVGALTLMLMAVINTLRKRQHAPAKQ